MWHKPCRTFNPWCLCIKTRCLYNHLMHSYTYHTHTPAESLPWHWGDRVMGLLPDTWNCGLRMRRKCRERFPLHRLPRKPLVSDPGMHHGTCVTHVPWCMSGSQTRSGGENVPGIPGACATHNFTYLSRGPLSQCKGNNPGRYGWSILLTIITKYHKE